MATRSKEVFRLLNEYADNIGNDFFDACPKQVFAALAVSYLVNHQAKDKNLTWELLNEWYTLHMQGIIPKAPPKKLWKLYGNGNPTE